MRLIFKLLMFFSISLVCKADVVHFSVDEDVLLAELLVSSSGYGEIQELRSKAEQLDKTTFDTLNDQMSQLGTVNFITVETASGSRLFRELKASEDFRSLLAETQEFKLRVEENWKTYFDTSSAYVMRATKQSFDFHGANVQVKIVHPAIDVAKNINIGQRFVVYGAPVISNQDIFLVWHEVLHGFFHDDVGETIEHAVIYAIANCGLREHLNGEICQREDVPSGMYSMIENAFGSLESYMQSSQSLNSFIQSLH